MSNYEKRLNDLERVWRQPARWKVWCTERAADGRLVDVYTGEEVHPRPQDTVIEFRTYEGGPLPTTEPPAI